MPNLPFTLAIIACCVLPIAHQARASPNEAGHIDRTIRKEPKYQSIPKYSLITLGDSGDVKVWMVEDGKRLYVDKNANGDLTDDGPPIEPGEINRLDEKRWSFRYTLDAITPSDGTRHTDLILRRWNYGDKEDRYGLCLSVNGTMPMYVGWYGTFWATTPEQAPVIHLGGPFTPGMLRRKEFTPGETKARLSLCFTNPDSGKGIKSYLSIDALPATAIPRLTIEWPTPDGHKPIRTIHLLTQRCCYWEFYTTDFSVPEGIVAGNAKISIDLPPEAAFIKLTTKEITMPVTASPKKKSDSES